MTRKDYQMVAKVCLALGHREISLGYREVFHTGHFARALADAFEEDNPRFDRARFLTAAGIIDYWYKKNAEPKRKVS